MFWQLQIFWARQKYDLHSVKLIFVPAQNAVKSLGWLKIFGPAQNILGPVKGQGISAFLKTFVPAQRTILLNANHIFVWHKMFVTATVRKKIFGLAQKIWTSPKHFGTCKRTRHYIDHSATLLNFYK